VSSCISDADCTGVFDGYTHTLKKRINPCNPCQKRSGCVFLHIHFVIRSYSLMDSSITAIFWVINSKSAFSFSILRFISDTRLLPFFDELVRKPMLFS